MTMFYNFFRSYWKQLVSFLCIVTGIFLFFSNNTSNPYWSIYTIEDYKSFHSNTTAKLENGIKNAKSYDSSLPNKYNFKSVDMTYVKEGIKLNQNSILLGVFTSKDNDKYYTCSKPYRKTTVGFIGLKERKIVKPIIGVLTPTHYYESYTLDHKEYINSSLNSKDFEVKLYNNLHSLVKDLLEQKIHYILYNKAVFYDIGASEMTFLPLLIDKKPVEEELVLFFNKEMKQKNMDFINKIILEEENKANKLC